MGGYTVACPQQRWRSGRGKARDFSGLVSRSQMMGAFLWTMYYTMGTDTSSEQFLYGCACAFTANGCIFLLSSVLSLQTALMLPKLYYVSARMRDVETCCIFFSVIMLLSRFPGYWVHVRSAASDHVRGTKTGRGADGCMASTDRGSERQAGTAA